MHRSERAEPVRCLLNLDADHPACVFFFFNDTATTEIYTLSLHDALPIWTGIAVILGCALGTFFMAFHSTQGPRLGLDRKSTRLNSSHSQISYAVFCLKKKKDRSAPPLVSRLCPLITSASAGTVASLHSMR